ncbi:MAG TPA: hypothetical protein V6C97_13295 [Oculatellaceae cyanobacterium]
MQKTAAVITSVCLTWLLSQLPERVNDAQAAAAKSTGWEIDYNSSFAGIVKIKFSDKAMNLKLEKMGLTAIAHAPKWSTLVYNETNKKYMSMTDEMFRTKFANSFNRKHKAATAEIKIEYTKKNQKIEGVSTTQVILKEKQPNGSMDITTDIWVAKALNSPPQFKQFLSKALRVPSDFQGTPLRISVKQVRPDKAPQMVQALDAYKVAKISVGDDDFKALTGYKEVKNEINLMMDDDDGSLLSTP